MKTKWGKTGGPLRREQLDRVPTPVLVDTRPDTFDWASVADAPLDGAQASSPEGIHTGTPIPKAYAGTYRAEPPRLTVAVLDRAVPEPELDWPSFEDEDADVDTTLRLVLAWMQDAPVVATPATAAVPTGRCARESRSANVRRSAARRASQGRASSSDDPGEPPEHLTLRPEGGGVLPAMSGGERLRHE
ncbi:MAG: hypothetical protein AABM42_02130 [Actinomycetota bacterium]